MLPHRGRKAISWWSRLVFGEIDLVEGEFSNPVRIVAFNIAEGWCRDVTVDIADELRCRVVEYGEISQSAIQFMQANQR